MTEMQKVEHKISKAEFGKPYNELKEIDQWFVDDAVCCIMQDRFDKKQTS